MSSLNKVMIIGNVGSEPEMRFTPNGNPVTSFRVATNRVYTTPDGGLSTPRVGYILILGKAKMGKSVLEPK